MSNRLHALPSARPLGVPPDSLARSLGWFSIGLGLVEVLAPRAMARALGAEGRENLIASYGLREIASGAGILLSRDPAPWVWGRVGGDSLDIATLAGGLERRNPRKGMVALALAAVGGVTALDIACARALDTVRAATARPRRDYSGRRGMPRPPDAMRGVAGDFKAPRDMRTPEALRPFPLG